MIYKPRHKSAELQVLAALNTRMHLPPNDKKNYLNLVKGLEGELRFDSFSEKLQCDCLVLNDLLLTSNNTSFQIDSLIITTDTIHLYEIKNFEGDYYYRDNRFYSMRHTEIVNPLHQLSRKETLLRPLLGKHGFKFPVDGNVVFVNENFTLYQAPVNEPIIYPTQLKNYFNNLNTIPSKLNKTHKMLADKLVSLHITDPPDKQKFPRYNFDQLRKGLCCGKCRSLTVMIEGKKSVCSNCNYNELVERTVVRAAKDFKLLFPEEKMTTSIIHDWCAGMGSKKQIRRILNQYFKSVNKNRWVYYE
ncbi:NERD domain-containing protein [Virgibacillus kimchii]